MPYLIDQARVFRARARRHGELASRHNSPTATGELHIHAWYYDVDTGARLGYDPHAITPSPL